MIRLAEVITRFEGALRSRFGHRLREEQRRALAALTHCRTAASPKFQVRCDACEHQQLIPHSCGHRHCPRCQHHEGQAWIEQQARRLVPAEYFLVTFTLPAELRALAEAEPCLVFDLLLRCGWETVRTFVGNDRHLRGSAGAIAILHTHSRRLDYHPHGHFVVPGAAIDEGRQRWRTKRGYLFSERALAKVFRGKLLAALRAAGCTVPQELPTAWVAHCQSVGSGQSALVYLGRYLYRGVIREEDILACDEDTVRFRYLDARTGQRQQRVLNGAEFLWLVLQHVLPKGFRRARNYGFLHPNRKRLIALLQLVLKCLPWLGPRHKKPRAPISCPCCGTPMVIARTRIPPALAPPQLGSAALV